MSTASSPPGGNPHRKRRIVSFRKSRVTDVGDFSTGDTIQLLWDAVKGEPQLVIESANGLKIVHTRLTLPPAAA